MYKGSFSEFLEKLKKDNAIVCCKECAPKTKEEQSKSYSVLTVGESSLICKRCGHEYHFEFQ